MTVPSFLKTASQKEAEQVSARIASIKDDVLISNDYRKAATDFQSLLNNHPTFKVGLSEEIKRLETILAAEEEKADERIRIANIWRLDYIIEQKTAEKEELAEALENEPDNEEELFARLETVDAELERAVSTKESLVEIGRNENVRATEDPLQQIEDEIIGAYIRQAKRRKERAATTGKPDRASSYAELQRILEESPPVSADQDLLRNIKVPGRKRIDPSKAERRAKLQAEIAKRRAVKAIDDGDESTRAIREAMDGLDAKIDQLNH